MRTQSPCHLSSKQSVNSVLAKREGQPFSIDPRPESGGYEIVCTCLGVAKSSGQTANVLSSGGPGVEATVVDSVSAAAARSDDADKHTTLLIPGGTGARPLVDDEATISYLSRRCLEVARVATVCTGTALLARSGALDGHEATSNKMALDWVVSQRPEAVRWRRKARWVRSAPGDDGDKRGGKPKVVWTSSGVSAGMDMALAMIAEDLGEDVADAAAEYAEYVANKDADVDPFAS